MRLAHIDVDGEEITIKLHQDANGHSASIHIDIQKFNLSEGLYLSREHAEILGKILISIAGEE